MSVLRTFIQNFNARSVLVTALAVASTYVCLRFGVEIDMPLELIGIAIVFPIVFSISGAFQRREAALGELAEFRSHLLGLCLAHRDWPDANRDQHGERMEGLARNLYRSLQAALREPRPDALEPIYDDFARISKSIETLRREAGVDPSDVSRANQYLKQAMMSFEKLRNIAIYRTPRSLRSYTQVFLNSFPVLFGPYFAFISSTSYYAVGYGVAVLYSLVLVGLDNIQEDLEDPYDGIGVDDIDFGKSGMTLVVTPGAGARREDSRRTASAVGESADPASGAAGPSDESSIPRAG